MSGSTEGPVGTVPLPVGSEEARVLLHATEYSALTMRATYLDAFSNAVWALMVAYLTFVANLWTHIGSKVLLAWGSALAVQIMLQAIQFFTSDRYMVVAYIEKHLIPIVADEVKRTNIWRWKKFLYERRGDKALFWEWPPALVSFACLGIVSVWRCRSRSQSQWGWIDSIGVVATFCLAAVSVRNTMGITRLRKEWEHAFCA